MKAPENLCFSGFFTAYKMTTMARKEQPPKVFFEKVVHKSFAKFTGKHLCRRLVFNKVAGLRSATLF